MIAINSIAFNAKSIGAIVINTRYKVVLSWILPEPIEERIPNSKIAFKIYSYQSDEINVTPLFLD